MAEYLGTGATLCLPSYQFPYDIPA